MTPVLNMSLWFVISADSVKKNNIYFVKHDIKWAIILKE